MGVSKASGSILHWQKQGTGPPDGGGDLPFPTGREEQQRAANQPGKADTRPKQGRLDVPKGRHKGLDVNEELGSP